MTERKPKPKQPKRNNVKTKPEPNAFDLWLNRGLHQIYDDIAQEPVPSEWLRLIEEDRSK